METRKVYRSQTDKVIAGVCGGLAQYFDIDPVLLRIAFVLLAIFGGGGVLIYIILWIVVPVKPLDFSAYQAATPPPPEEEYRPTGEEGSQQAPPPPPPMKSSARKTGSLLGGLILVLVGILFLFREFVWDFPIAKFWPVILVAIGAVLVAGAFNTKRD